MWILVVVCRLITCDSEGYVKDYNKTVCIHRPVCINVLLDCYLPVSEALVVLVCTNRNKQAIKWPCEEYKACKSLSRLNRQMALLIGSDIVSLLIVATQF